MILLRIYNFWLKFEAGLCQLLDDPASIGLFTVYLKYTAAEIRKKIVKLHNIEGNNNGSVFTLTTTNPSVDVAAPQKKTMTLNSQTVGSTVQTKIVRMNLPALSIAISLFSKCKSCI